MDQETNAAGATTVKFAGRASPFPRLPSVIQWKLKFSEISSHTAARMPTEMARGAAALRRSVTCCSFAGRCGGPADAGFRGFSGAGLGAGRRVFVPSLGVTRRGSQRVRGVAEVPTPADGRSSGLPVGYLIGGDSVRSSA
jgi:hypothetical protein